MSAPDHLRFPTFEELARRVGARGVEQAIAGDIAKACRDKRFGDEAFKSADGSVIVEVRAGRDGAGRFKRERACEYREPAQDHAFLRRQKIIAPLDCCVHGLMPRQGRTPALPQKPEPIIELPQCLLDAVRLDATSGELYRQRYPVEFATDFADRRRIGIVQFETPSAGVYASDEKLDRGKIECLCRGKICISRRTGQRSQLMNMLPLDTQAAPDWSRGCEPPPRPGRFAQSALQRLR